MTSLVSPQLADQLSHIVGASHLLLDEPLSKHTTFKIGGPADALVLPTSIEQVRQIIAACRETQIPLRFMGLGSNILASDAEIGRAHV